MSFDYDEIRLKKHAGGTQWAAYSDLFMVLAFIFLLMYMVSSLRTGMESVTAHAQMAQAEQELKLYRSTKETFLKNEASPEEQRVYRDVMSHLDLLENEARAKKLQLAKDSREQATLEAELNRYQRMIVAMANASLVAKADAARVISSEQQRNVKLEEEINQKRDGIDQLKQRIQAENAEMMALRDAHNEETRKLADKYKELKQQHEDNKEDLASLNDMLNSEAKEKALLKLEHQRETESLQTKINDLKEQHEDGQQNLAALEDILRNKEETVSDLINTYSQEKSSMQRQIDQLRDRNDEYLNKVAQLNEQRRIESKERRALQADLERETNDLKDEINNIRRTNNSNEAEIAKLEQKLQQVKDEKSDLKDAAYETKKELENKLRDLRTKNDGNNAMIAMLEDDLKDKEAQGEAQKDAYEDTKQEMEDQIKQLQEDYLANKNKLSDLEDERKKQLAAMSSDLEDAKDNLAKATDELGKAKEDLADREKELGDALQMAQNRRDLAKRIGDNFKSHGIVADVNKKTGDVVLDFGQYYFDTDSHQLKAGMEQIIRKAIPVYAQSLFGSKALGSNISSVEIIGFASPTYAGKPVDPTELSAQNRRAVNYNLDLSYRRARSIFEFIFDTDNIRFDHQDQMVHLLNVTGRSFFTEKVDPRDTGGLTIDEFCRQYDCLKSQRVIIKFGLTESET